MWNPYARPECVPFDQTREPTPDVPPPPQPALPPPTWEPLYRTPHPFYPSNLRQLPIPQPQPLIPQLQTAPNLSFFNAPLSFEDECDFLHPPIKVEDRDTYPTADSTYLPPFLPSSSRPATPSQLPPFSSVGPSSGPRPTNSPPLPSFAPHPRVSARMSEAPSPTQFHHYQPATPEIDSSSQQQARKRPREAVPQTVPPPSTTLPPIFAPPVPRTSPSFLSQPQHLPHPPYLQQHQPQLPHQPEPARQARNYTSIDTLPQPTSLVGEEDNNNPNNKRQRFSVVSTTSVRTNRSGYPAVASTTTTTTTISTSTTTTTTSRSVSTTTTAPGSVGPVPAFPPFFGSAAPSGLPNPALLMHNMLNRIRHDTRPPMMMPNIENDMWGRGLLQEDDMRSAFDDLRQLVSRSSTMLHPFFQFRAARGGSYADDDDDEDEEEEEEEVPSFDQMNLPEIEFKEGASEINEKMCVICQDEYKQGDKLSKLPCVHHFHTGCIKKWVDECKPECPLCKAALA